MVEAKLRHEDILTAEEKRNKKNEMQKLVSVITVVYNGVCSRSQHRRNWKQRFNKYHMRKELIAGSQKRSFRSRLHSPRGALRHCEGR